MSLRRKHKCKLIFTFIGIFFIKKYLKSSRHGESLVCVFNNSLKKRKKMKKNIIVVNPIMVNKNKETLEMDSI